MAKTISIYTTNTCVYCVQVKKFLESKGLTYDLINLDDHPERTNELLELTGQLAVPVTVVSDNEDKDAPKDVTVGWNPAKLTTAIASMVPPHSQAA
jgi:glutaredoxin 3